MIAISHNILRNRISAVQTTRKTRSRQTKFNLVHMSASTLSQQTMQKLIPGFIQWIDHCNNGISAITSGQFIKFSINHDASPVVGYLTASFAQRLAQYPDVFTTLEDGTISLVPSLSNSGIQERSNAVATVMSSLRDQGLITGWREELYPVQNSFYESPQLLLERAASPFFGIKAYGVHINGYVTHKDGSKQLWVARRSANKPTWPGCLDHIVAGGQPYGLSLRENVIKECGEEAGIPKELAEKAISVGAVSYMSLQRGGLKRDVLFCYDLELPLDFTPTPQDGEVSEFFLMPLDEVASIIGTTAPMKNNETDAIYEDTSDNNNNDKESSSGNDPYKDNCNLVIIDFLIRHGVLQPSTPGYLDIVRKLRSGDCS